MRKLRLAALNARTRRMLRHTTTPAERALASVIIAPATADHAAALLANRSAAAEPTELASAERVLTAALEYLSAIRDVRTPRW